MGRDGTFSGTLQDPVVGTVPVAGQVMGREIRLTFDLGPQGKAGGVGPFVARRIGPGQVRLVAVGSLQTSDPADSGDWSWSGYWTWDQVNQRWYWTWVWTPDSSGDYTVS